METTQGNALCNYLYLKLTKMPCFSIFCFFFYKIEEQEGRTSSGGGVSNGVGKGYEDEYNANNVYTFM
jgi:hypothetical protein